MPSANAAWLWVCAQAEANAERAAASAGAIAARHERLLAEGTEAMRRLHWMMATTHRRIEGHHHEAARRFRDRAKRLAMGQEHGAAALDLLITVARALGAGSVALTLLGSARYEEAAIASSSIAAAAQELEFTLGEGPVHDAVESRRLVTVDEAAMRARWAQYSTAVTELGVRSVTAAPLCMHTTCIGVLTAFDPPEATAPAVVDRLAWVLVDAVFGNGAEWPVTELDDRLVVHQATGMVAAQLRCPASDALAMLRARAFAENEAIGVLARRVVDREIRFD